MESPVNYLMHAMDCRRKGDQDNYWLYMGKAADGGLLVAQYYMARLYLERENGPLCLEYAIKAEQNASAMDNRNDDRDIWLVQIWYILGRVYLYGYGMDSDARLAFQYLDRIWQNPQKSVLDINDLRQHHSLAVIALAELMDDPQAMLEAGKICMDVGTGLYNPERSFHWFNEAYNHGCQEALRYMADSYYWGRGVERNYARALDIYLRICDGHWTIMSSISLIYSNGGYGVEPDAEKARYWHQKALQLSYSDPSTGGWGMYGK